MKIESNMVEYRIYNLEVERDELEQILEGLKLLKERTVNGSSLSPAMNEDRNLLAKTLTDKIIYIQNHLKV